jgi:7,8-dihydropterin-6-yl-methyl-4-(beta-D-ribofuranosyl)aminobenzene 5'-phosphate synthase
MKLTVLVDNNTVPDAHFYGEPGLSLWIEEDGKNILFDTGYSNVYINNAKKLGIDLSKTDYIVLSHGHNDHTVGLKYFPYPSKKVTLITHPNTLYRKFDDKEYFGSPVLKDEADKLYSYIKTDKPYFITPNTVFLGEINRQFEFEKTTAIGFTEIESKKQPDYLNDDTGLAIKTDKGVFVITGCSHSGVCNIIAQARDIFKLVPVVGVIGGFHLLNANVDRLTKTANYFKGSVNGVTYPCHCTDLNAKIAIAGKNTIEEVFVGKTINV